MPAKEQDYKEKPRFVPEKDIVSWKSASRPFKRRTREFYVTLFAIVGVVGLVFFLIEGLMPVILLVSVTFLFYVLNTVEPGQIDYKITNKGLKVANRLTEWDLIGRYWFSKRENEEVLNFDTHLIPNRLEIVIDSSKKHEIKKALLKYVPEEKSPPDTLNKATNWLAGKITKS